MWKESEQCADGEVRMGCRKELTPAKATFWIGAIASVIVESRR